MGIVQQNRSLALCPSKVVYAKGNGFVWISCFGVQSVYVLRAVLADLLKRKFATLTVLVIAVSLTIPTVSYLLWKNIHRILQFYWKWTNRVFTQKLDKGRGCNLVVEKIPSKRRRVESLNYVSRRKVWTSFAIGQVLAKSWTCWMTAVAGGGDVKPAKAFNESLKPQWITGKLG